VEDIRFSDSTAEVTTQGEVAYECGMVSIPKERVK